MIVLTLSAIIMKERMQNEKFWNRSGTRWNCFLILYGKSGNATHAGLGNFLVLVTLFPMDFT
jgi:hypothetical protein